MRILGIIMLAVFGLAANVNAYDFSKADNLFNLRGGDFNKATEARGAYVDAINSGIKGADLIYAVSQTARLDIYRGDMLLALTETGKRKEIFRECENTVEKINPSAVGAHTMQYYHWSIYCVALFGKSASTVEKLGKLRKLKRLIGEAPNHGTVYEGGGVLRTIAGIYSNSGAKVVGMYKPEDAVTLAQQALKSGSYKDRAYPAALTGAQFYENTIIYAEALVALSDKTKDVSHKQSGIRLIQKTLQKLEALKKRNRFPKGREAETEYQITRYKRFLAETK